MTMTFDIAKLLKTMESLLLTSQYCEGAADCKFGNDYNEDSRVGNYYYG